MSALPEVRSRAATARDALLDLLLPRACVLCDRLLDVGDAGPVCARCWVRARPLPYPRCDRCGHPTGPHRCRWCDLLSPIVRAARSVCWIPGGSAGHIVHALKYGGWPAVAGPMAQRMARLTWPRDVIDERAVLISVLFALVRQRERMARFNGLAMVLDCVPASGRLARSAAVVFIYIQRIPSQLGCESRLVATGHRCF